MLNSSSCNVLEVLTTFRCVHSSLFVRKINLIPCNFRYIKVLSGQSNYVTRRLREAVKLYQDGNYDKAFMEYLILAEAGVEMAQYNVGWLCQEFPEEVRVIH